MRCKKLSLLICFFSLVPAAVANPVATSQKSRCAEAMVEVLAFLEGNASLSPSSAKQIRSKHEGAQFAYNEGVPRLKAMQKRWLKPRFDRVTRKIDVFEKKLNDLSTRFEEDYTSSSFDESRATAYRDEIRSLEKEKDYLTRVIDQEYGSTSDPVFLQLGRESPTMAFALQRPELLLDGTAIDVEIQFPLRLTPQAIQRRPRDSSNREVPSMPRLEGHTFKVRFSEQFRDDMEGLKWRHKGNSPLTNAEKAAALQHFCRAIASGYVQFPSDAGLKVMQGNSNRVEVKITGVGGYDDFRLIGHWAKNKSGEDVFNIEAVGDHSNLRKRMGYQESSYGEVFIE